MSIALPLSVVRARVLHDLLDRCVDQLPNTSSRAYRLEFSPDQANQVHNLLIRLFPNDHAQAQVVWELARVRGWVEVDERQVLRLVQHDLAVELDGAGHPVDAALTA